MNSTHRKGTSTKSFGVGGRINHDSEMFYKNKMMQSGIDKFVSNELVNDFPIELTNQIIVGDATNMKEIPDNSVHLIITSPPYNCGKEYDEDLSLEEYKHLLFNFGKESYRVLIPGGRICINIANVGRQPYRPLNAYLAIEMEKLNFKARGEIIWVKGEKAGNSLAWGSWMSASNPILRDTHEYIQIYSKNTYKRLDSGKTAITKDNFMEYTTSIWKFNPESATRVNHPAPFPIELPARLIELYSYENDVILDPFMGSGTTAMAALKTDRRFVGYEKNPEYVKYAMNRINSYQPKLKLQL